MDKEYKRVICYMSLNEKDKSKREYIKIEKIKRIKEFINNNFEEDQLSIDEGIWESIYEKPQIKKVINKIESKEIDTFIITNLYDLEISLVKSIEFVKYLLKKDIRFISIDNNIDTFCDIQYNNK